MNSNQLIYLLSASLTCYLLAIRFGQLGVAATAGSWGANPFPAQLAPALFGNRTAAAFAAGAVHSVVVTDDGRVWAFGSNLKGQLGVPDSYGVWGAVVSRPVEIPPWRIGGPAGALTRQEMGQQLAQKGAALAQQQAAQQALAARLEQLMRWGVSLASAGAKQVMEEMTQAAAAAAALEQAIAADEALLSEGGSVVAVAAGGKHTLLLTRNGSVFGFGSNYYGQLLTLPLDSTPDPFRIGGDGTLLASVSVTQVC